MASAQAEAFGFPNPLLGVAGFAVVAATGAALLAGGRLAEWFWAGLQAGVTAAVVFVHWLMFAACTASRRCARTAWSSGRSPSRSSPPSRSATSPPGRPDFPPGSTPRSRQCAGRHSVLLTAWFLLVVAAITQRFRLYWSTLVG